MTPQEKGNALYNYVQDKVINPSLTIAPSSAEIYFEYLEYSFNIEIITKEEIRINVSAYAPRYPQFDIHSNNQAYWQHQGELQRNNEEMLKFLKELNEKFELGLSFKEGRV